MTIDNYRHSLSPGGRGLCPIATRSRARLGAVGGSPVRSWIAAMHSLFAGQCPCWVGTSTAARGGLQPLDAVEDQVEAELELLGVVVTVLGELFGDLHEVRVGARRIRVSLGDDVAAPFR